MDPVRAARTLVRRHVYEAADTWGPLCGALLKMYGVALQCSNWGYSNYSSWGLGCDRTSAGSGYAAQYVHAWTKIFDDPARCPEALLLFFHNLPWNYIVRSSGKPLIQHIYTTHFEGVRQVQKLASLWSGLKGLNKVMQGAVAQRFQQQLVDASFFRDVLVAYWANVSHVPHATTK